MCAGCEISVLEKRTALKTGFEYHTGYSTSVESMLLAGLYRNAPLPLSEKLNLKELDYILTDLLGIQNNG
jgi:hypothetical protein